MDDIRGQGAVVPSDNGNDAAEGEVVKVSPRVSSSGPQPTLINLCGQSGSAGLVRGDSTSFFQPALNVLKQLNKNDLSFYLFSRKCAVREACLSLAGAPAFGKAVLLLVFLNCVTLAMEPGPCNAECQKSEYMRALFVTDTIFTVCFTLEIVCQAIAHCFLLGPSAYLRDGWNWIDFLSTASGYITFLPLGGSGSGLNGLRGLRAMRPLRMLKAIPGQ
ncbi:hypothetical protein VaNZ11_009700 [Volvox africanus]|uniref:Ion transport domain-containing protein n=1 Tax=Volvox africanus TaxID=51714 RepID=A0ABQ5S9U1_9CHLO|nr:hypothetical protein VaNZ11_009700 [Volvox africanus]